MPDPSWAYNDGVLSGSGTITKAGKCRGISIRNNSVSAACSFKINGGATITVPASGTLDINPGGKLMDCVITWVSGSFYAFIEVCN